VSIAGWTSKSTHSPGSLKSVTFLPVLITGETIVCTVWQGTLALNGLFVAGASGIEVRWPRQHHRSPRMEPFAAKQQETTF